MNDKNYLNAYYSFTGITYLMICLNYIFSKRVKMTMRDRMTLNREVLTIPEYNDMINNIDNIKLPITRKISIYFAKYRIFIGIYFVMKVKTLLNERN